VGCGMVSEGRVVVSVLGGGGFCGVEGIWVGVEVWVWERSG